MITHIVDTDVIIDYLADRAGSRSLLRPLIDAGALAVSVVAYGEVYEGVSNNPSVGQLLSDLEEFVAGVAMLEITRQTAEIFAALRRQLRSQGRIIPDHDIWIAASALQYDLTLITRDGHFSRIESLKRHA